MMSGVYNSRILQMLILSPRLFRLVRLLVVFLLLTSAFTFGGNFTIPEEQIAHRIAAVTGPAAISIEFNNRSAIPKSDFETVRRELLTEIASLGLHFVPTDQAAATIQFSLSEGLQGYIWIAEISQGTNAPVVVMVGSPRGGAALMPRPSTSLILRKNPLWTQDLRILDAALIEGNPSHLIVLDVEKIVAYRFQDNRWQAEQTLPVTHSRAWPRDSRGRLVLRHDRLLDAYLPGVVCQSSAESRLTLSCRPSDDPWPLGPEQFGVNGFFATTRNYLTGALAPGIGKQATTVPFYSAAILPREKYTLGLFAGVDGQIHILDGITDRSAGKLGWGGNMAVIRTTCGSGWQVLASRSGMGSSDAITAYEFPDREPVTVSQALDFTGPVVELWTESDGFGAIAIIRNSNTGQYEASRLTVACNQ